MKHPLSDATDLREPVALLARYRLLPLREINPGEIAWCGADNKVLAYTRPGATTVPPNATTTACLAPVDYRIVTAQIALIEERSCQ